MNLRKQRKMPALCVAGAVLPTCVLCQVVNIFDLAAQMSCTAASSYKICHLRNTKNEHGWVPAKLC